MLGKKFYTLTLFGALFFYPQTASRVKHGGNSKLFLKAKIGKPFDLYVLTKSIIYGIKSNTVTETTAENFTAANSIAQHFSFE
jgi:hypothetical protein